MKFNVLFPVAALGLAIGAASGQAMAQAAVQGADGSQSAGSAGTHSFAVAPTSVYGGAESQAAIRFRGPGLPGGEAQQTIGTGSRHPLFDVAGYDGVIFAPVTPPYNAAATYTTYAGQPGRGTTNAMAQGTDGAP